MSAFGDLDGDGIEDGAVILVVNYGGNSVYAYIHPVLNRGSEPNVLSGLLIDESPLIHSLDMENGRIILVASVHYQTDAHCCPTRLVANQYLLVGDELQLVSQIDLPEPLDYPDRDTY